MTATIPGTVRVLILVGEEFQRLERLGEVLETAVDPATRDFNMDTLLAEDVGESDDGPRRPSGVSRLANICAAYPMMAERRVVVVRDVDALHQAVRAKVFDIAADLPESTLLILEGEKVKPPAKFPKQGLSVETFKPVYENMLPGWVQNRFARRGRKATPAAVALLVNNAGTVPGELDSEVEKVCTAVAGDGVIDENAVTSVVGAFRHDTVWNLQNAVGDGDFNRVVEIFEGLTASEKNKEPSYLSMIGSHVLRIAAYNEQRRQGVGHDEAMKVLVNSPYMWKVKGLERQVGRFTPARVRRTLTALSRMDSLFKKHGVDRRLMLDLLTVFIAPGTPVRNTNTGRQEQP